ncbi:CPBP family intramembrane glutamic endopeptidase [Paraburkholderia phenazinium]|uniref:CAAX prenyl protease 2/Lysostaphin resistance protein A-like domain-containing protein n=2 Tax=Paraburkholderia phenazinium TaxID=60549 RepID=A0A1G8IIR5_9BURK|nr:type II CAAX endopeptidase family protein [Paraburkholderia phenazinium]SDI18784.1 hypothetical protein SAMN05216466_118123 [Paraburkholderia phenazinium]
MLLRILKIIVVAACAVLMLEPAGAAPSSGLAVEDLRLPDRMSDVVVNGEKSAYENVLGAYREALTKHPADAGLALAQCKFTERFAASEDLSWADVASQDLATCQSTLEKQFSSDPEAVLFVLENRFGKQAIDYGEPLLKSSNNWSAVQQARLHAALSRSYAFTKNDTRAGQEAVLAVRLDPASERLVEAMHYLVKTGQAKNAANLLAAAPMPKLLWQENARIRAATELLPGTEALDELHRAQRAGPKIDAYTTARALQHVGDSAGAEAALTADAASHKFESPQNQQLRLEVAFDSGNAKAAADVIHDQYVKTGKAAGFIGAYAHLLNLDPALIGRLDLLPLAFGLLAAIALVAASPGVLLFPVHYRGTVRQRIGKVSVPIFARIGLRHAWLALAIYFVLLYLVTALHSGMALISPVGSGASRIDWQSRVAASYLWALLFCALGLAWIAKLLSWRDWLGSGSWKLKWFIVPAGLLLIDLLATGWLHHAGVTKTASNVWAVALVHGAVAIGGTPLALLVLSVFVPIMEELVFRGCLLGGLSRHISFGWSNVLQAALFAGLHQDSRHLVFLFALGVIAGWLARKTKGLSMPILLHALNNAIFVFSVVS